MIHSLITTSISLIPETHLTGRHHYDSTPSRPIITVYLAATMPNLNLQFSKNQSDLPCSRRRLRIEGCTTMIPGSGTIGRQLHSCQAIPINTRGRNHREPNISSMRLCTVSTVKLLQRKGDLHNGHRFFSMDVNRLLPFQTQSLHMKCPCPQVRPPCRSRSSPHPSHIRVAIAYSP